jgi:hypothetical protein
MAETALSLASSEVHRTSRGGLARQAKQEEPEDDACDHATREKIGRWMCIPARRSAVCLRPRPTLTPLAPRQVIVRPPPVSGGRRAKRRRRISRHRCRPSPPGPSTPADGTPRAIGDGGVPSETLIFCGGTSIGRDRGGASGALALTARRAQERAARPARWSECSPWSRAWAARCRGTAGREGRRHSWPSDGREWGARSRCFALRD